MVNALPIEFAANQSKFSILRFGDLSSWIKYVAEIPISDNGLAYLFLRLINKSNNRINKLENNEHEINLSKSG